MPAKEWHGGGIGKEIRRNPTDRKDQNCILPCHAYCCMRKGSKNGFAVSLGNYRFKKDGNHTVQISTANTNGKVIADGVAFVKIAD